MGLDGLDRTIQTRPSLTRIIQTLRVRTPSPDAAVFSRPRGMTASFVILVIGTLGMAVIAPLLMYHLGNRSVPDLVFDVPFLLLWEAIVIGTLLGGVLVCARGRTVVFDKIQGRFWRKGRRDPIIGDYAALKDIAGLQVCSSRSSTGGGLSVPIYELNVVMNRPPGRRFPIVCHGARSEIFEDARKLAEFLNVPLVDHTEPGSSGA